MIKTDSSLLDSDDEFRNNFKKPVCATCKYISHLYFQLIEGSKQDKCDNDNAGDELGKIDDDDSDSIFPFNLSRTFRFI
jgi:hypothetical protein